MQSMTVINKQNEKPSAEKSKRVQNSLAVKTPVMRKADPLEIIQRVRTKPDSISHDDMMVLQSTIGNRAVIKLLSEVKGSQDAQKAETQPKDAGGQDVPSKVESKETKEAVQVNPQPVVTSEKKNPDVDKAEKEEKTNKVEKEDKTDKSRQEEKTEKTEKAVNANPGAVQEKEKPVQAAKEKEKNAPLQSGQVKASSKEESTEAPENKKKEVLPPKEDKVPENTRTEAPAGGKEAPAKSSVDHTAAVPGEKAKKPPKEQAVKINGEDPGKIIEQLSSIPPSQIYNAFSQAEAVSGGALEKQMHKAQAVIPSVPAPTGINSGEPVGQGEKKINPINHTAPEGFKSEKSGGKTYEGVAKDFNAGSGGDSEADPEEIMAEARAQSANPPSISMTGEADPSQVSEFKAEAAQNVRAAQKAELSQVDNEFGENRILPKPDNTIIKAQKSVQTVTPPSVGMEPMEAIPPEVATRMNPSLVPILKNHLEGRKNEYQKGRVKFDADIIAAKAGTEADIEQMKSEAKEKQLNEQAEAKAQVNALRGEWRSEINGAVAEYDQKAESASEEKKREIGNVKAEKESQVNTTMADAEKDANKEYKTAKAQAEDKKKEEKEGGGFYGWIKEKAQQFVEGIKKAVNAIFDGLRKAVKSIFDKAKQLAMNIIEAGRKLIVNMIKGLGQFLKGLVKTVFAKFPGIANKICSKIDQAVNKAVKVVNDTAALLKKGVGKALDFLAKSVDTLIAGAQSLYNGIFSGIGKFLKGEFKIPFGKILEGAQITAEIAAAFATGGGSILLQIGIWLGTTLPELFNKVTSVIGFVNDLKNAKLDDVKQFLSPAKMGDFMVKGLFGELNGLPQGEKEEKEKEEEPAGGKEGKGLAKVLYILSGLFKTLKGVYGKVAGGINKILPVINISVKPWFDPFSMIYAGAVKAMEVVKNPAEALNEGAEKVKEAIGGFFSSIKGKLGEVAQGIKEKVALIGQPAQLMKVLANKAVDMVLNFIITHPPSALIKAAFKAVEAAAGKSIVELVRQHIPFADKLINKIAESGPVQGILNPLQRPVKQVGSMIDEVSERAVGMVDESEQKAVGVFGSGAKLLKGLAGGAGEKKAAGPGGGQKAEGGGDFLGGIKSGIHTRLINLGAKLLQKGKALVTGAVDKVKGLVLGPKVRFKIQGESHELWVEKQGSKTAVMMASKEEKIREKIKDFYDRTANIKDNTEKGKIVRLTQDLEKLTGKLEAIQDPKQIAQQDIDKVIGLITKIYSALSGVSEVDEEGEKSAIDEFIAGERPFDAVVLDEYVEVYSSMINENVANWSWNKDIPGGNKLSQKQRATIRQKAIEVKAIPSVEIKKVKGLKYGYADFMGAGLVKVRYVLPKELWKADDKTQFDWLNNKLRIENPEVYPEGCTELQPPGYTWHHSEGKGIDGLGGDDDGVMYLISYGIHHAYTHNGGRSKGHWSDAPRVKKQGKIRGKKKK